MKSGKAPGLDGFPVECLRKGGTAVLESRYLSLDMGVVPMDWRGACIVPLYKGKGDKCECSNSRSISLLSVVGKLYSRVQFIRVMAGTKCAIGEEQCGFRQGRGCMDQVFAIRQVGEKYHANWKVVFWAFTDLKKAYDTIDRHGMWQMLRVYMELRKILESSAEFLYIRLRGRVSVREMM